MKKTLVMTALTLIAVAPSAQAQDIAAGEQSFKKCLPCHAVGEGAKKNTTRAPFPIPSAGGSNSPVGGSSRPPMGGSVAPFPIPGTKPANG